ncbi:hypothetical protein K474DRAFT_1585727 [Panus rudis PR-1116 ss-1]|nr:hypothetical protein K474DRAFT_1585727 [Panus rudis PR-1116 ss-1]
MDTDQEGGAAEDDAPVLSHAEKRRQKRKEQKQSRLDDPCSKGVKQKNGVQNTELEPSKASKRKHSVWVGNLSFKTTPDALRRFFDGVGEITRMHMPMKLTSGGHGSKGAIKENRGFAYVDFATADAKTLAIALSENPLDGRRLLIKDGMSILCDDFSGRPSTSKDDPAAGGKPTGTTKTAQKILAAQKQPAGPTLFIGNLGFEATEDTIRNMFDRSPVKPADGDVSEIKLSASIRKIRMGTFEDSGKCKGWAFVDFNNTEAATTALTSRSRWYLDGRQLVVEFASPDAVRRGGFRNHGDKEGAAGKRREPKEKDPEHNIAATGSGKRKAHSEETKDEDGEGEASQKRRKGDADKQDRARFTRDGRPKVRAKPGAALAMAKREQVNIVPSQGKKVVFD